MSACVCARARAGTYLERLEAEYVEHRDKARRRRPRDRLVDALPPPTALTMAHSVSASLGWLPRAPARVRLRRAYSMCGPWQPASNICGPWQPASNICGLWQPASNICGPWQASSNLSRIGGPMPQLQEPVRVPARASRRAGRTTPSPSPPLRPPRPARARVARVRVRVRVRPCGVRACACGVRM